MIEVRSALRTLRGRRPANQDAVMEVALPGGRQLLALADGMGGHRSGEVASAMAMEVLATELRAGGDLAYACRAANRAVFERASRDPECAGMGTTLVALLRAGPVYHIANIGDSRAYRVDREGIRQITRDHSFAAEAARDGQLSPAEVARSPWRNALTRALGTDPEVQVDVFGPFESSGAPHAVLLCSDGLYRAVPDALLQERLLRAPDPAVAVETLSALALERRSDDNISVVVAEFGALIHEPVHEPDRRPAGEAAVPIAAVRPAAAVRTAPRRRRSASRKKSTLPQLRRAASYCLSEEVLFTVSLSALTLWVVLTFLGG